MVLVQGREVRNPVTENVAPSAAANRSDATLSSAHLQETSVHTLETFHIFSILRRLKLHEDATWLNFLIR